MEKGDGRFCSCSKTHWEQLIQALKQKDNVERATQLQKIHATQKVPCQVGHANDHNLEE